MKYIDDILYLAGWLFMIGVAFSYDWRAGLISMGAGCWVTAVIIAKSGMRSSIRDKPRGSDL